MENIDRICGKNSRTPNELRKDFNSETMYRDWAMRDRISSIDDLRRLDLGSDR